MLYLLRSFTRCGTILKVGFASSFSRRFQEYRNTNPGIEPVATREGTLEDESLLHLYLRSIGCFKEIKREWYVDSPVVLEKFHSSIDTIKSYLWIHRCEVFPTGSHVFKDQKERWINLYKLLHPKRNNYRLTAVDRLFHLYSKSAATKKHINDVVDTFLDSFGSLSTFSDKMKLLCEFMERNNSRADKNYVLHCIPKIFKNYYKHLGSKRISELNYLSFGCEKSFRNIVMKTKVGIDIVREFKVGEYLSVSEIIKRVNDIYKRNSYSVHFNGADVLKEYFELERHRGRWENGRKINGIEYKILGIKEEGIK